MTNHWLTVQETLTQLAEDELITQQDAIKVASVARATAGTNRHPLVIIANQKIPSVKPPHNPLSLEKITYWLAGKADLPYFRIDPLKIDVATVTGLISHAYAVRYRILPVAVRGNIAVFATSEPYLTEWQLELQRLLNKTIERVVANPLDIERYLLEFYRLSTSVRGASDKNEVASDVLNMEQLLDLTRRSGELGAEDRPVVQIVDWLLQYAFEQRASDIHLEPRRDKGYIRLRIDGVLHAIYDLPPNVMNAVISRIKILGRMNVAERRRPQDGRIKTRTPLGREVELRLSTMPTAFGEKCVMRIFDPDIVMKDFTQLGFSLQEVAAWENMIRQPNGIVLVTGPTGSGKTTTLYSTLRSLARPEINVCTVEDPIEMVSPEFNQTQVQPTIDLTFAQGIRTLLRQDPDIIMVGEIRDVETAQMAVQASLTGHLVLSTLHTNDAPAAISRLLDIGVPAYLMQGTLVGIVAQRLVRKLCPHCKETEKLSDADWEALIHPWSVAKPDLVGKSKGCLECRNTGYLGRMGIYEMLTVTSALRTLLRDGPDLAAIRRQAYQDGMQPLRLSAAQQIIAGLTTVEEVMKVLPALEDRYGSS
jgi:general secretion pathway protein E